jgi:hypothetical protein
MSKSKRNLLIGWLRLKLFLFSLLSELPERKRWVRLKLVTGSLIISCLSVTGCRNEPQKPREMCYLIVIDSNQGQKDSAKSMNEKPSGDTIK